MSSAAQALYGSKTPSLAQKWLMQVYSWFAVGAAAWLLLGEGGRLIARHFHGSWPVAVPLRRELLIACSAIYAARLVFTQFYLVKRQLAWGESFTIAIWLWVIHGTMTYLGGRDPDRVGAAVWIGLGLFVLGSCINTGSELLRDLWKKHPENKGRLYTGGFFRYSMHVNYFGDVVLFSGFSLVTGSLYAFVIPLLMACMFVFINIPMLDEYLASRYGDQFKEYSAKTARFIPFVY